MAHVVGGERQRRPCLQSGRLPRSLQTAKHLVNGSPWRGDRLHAAPLHSCKYRWLRAPRNQIYPRGFAPRTPLHARSLQPSLVLSLRRRLALVRVRSLTAFARVVIRGTVLASLRSLAAGTVGGWVRFASLARDLVSDWCPRTPHRHAATHFAQGAVRGLFACARSRRSLALSF